LSEQPANLLDAYKAAAAADSGNAEAHANLGWGYYGLRDYSPAIDAFDAAIARDRNMLDAHYGRALALKKAGNGPAAIASFQDVLSLAPALENQVRGQMLARLAQGHINHINTSDWNLGREVRRAKS
jgi:tetratricopeptide (TPR) repeat protein